jgi:hypothetical protein
MNKLYVPKIAKDSAKLAHAREDYKGQMNLPRGNCPICDKQWRTPKDTKETWYWLGFQMGHFVMQAEARKFHRKLRGL